MFLLTNGKVQLQPFKVSYTRTFSKIVKDGYFDEETHKYIKPVIEKEEKEVCCWFETAEKAEKYAEEVNGRVEDLTPKPEIVSALATMIFASAEEVKAFIETGVEPVPKVTLESLAEVVADMIGGAIDVN